MSAGLASGIRNDRLQKMRLGEDATPAKKRKEAHITFG
jgi:hypothetical protein